MIAKFYDIYEGNTKKNKEIKGLTEITKKYKFRRINKS